MATHIKRQTRIKRLNAHTDLGPHQFVVNEKQWKLFLDELDRPSQVIPQIRRLFSDPTVAESRF